MHTPDQVMFKAEVEKKHKYFTATAAAHFTLVVFLLTASLVLKLLVLLRDLQVQVVFHLTGIGAILKFCAGFAPGWHFAILCATGL